MSSLSVRLLFNIHLDGVPTQCLYWFISRLEVFRDYKFLFLLKLAHISIYELESHARVLRQLCSFPEYCPQCVILFYFIKLYHF